MSLLLLLIFIFKPICLLSVLSLSCLKLSQVSLYSFLFFLPYQCPMEIVFYHIFDYNVDCRVHYQMVLLCILQPLIKIHAYDGILCIINCISNLG